jgi:hypothetical protein
MQDPHEGAARALHNARAVPPTSVPTAHFREWRRHEVKEPLSRPPSEADIQVLWRGIPDTEASLWKERTITQHEMGLDWRRA